MTSYIVAEIGINHNGSRKLMASMIRSAKRAGADAVKFQNYKTEKFIHTRQEWWTYPDGTREKQYNMFKRNELSLDDLRYIDDTCREVGIDWHSTPMCIDGLNELLRLGVKVLKNGSDCLQDLPLIRAMARTGLHTVISTGMAEVQEITDAVDAFYGTAGHGKLTLLHCTSAYPAPDDSMNVSAMRALKTLYRCDVGLSDHSDGITAAILSVAYGATWIEKHFTFNKRAPGPDHSFSADPNEFSELVRAVRKAERQVGLPKLGMTELERENRKAWFKQ